MYLVDMLDNNSGPNVVPIAGHQAVALFQGDASHFPFVRGAQHALKLLVEAEEIIPDDVVQAIREIHHKALVHHDTAWSASLVRSFFQASQPLRLGMEEASYKEQTVDILLGRLQKDLITHENFSVHRIDGVRKAFGAMDMRFTPLHGERVMEGLFSEFVSAIRHDRTSDLNAMAEKIHTAEQSMQFVLRRG